jgi:hypothetical protein
LLVVVAMIGLFAVARRRWRQPVTEAALSADEAARVSRAMADSERR